MPNRVRILGCDHLNLARGKYVTEAHARRGEARFCQSVYAMTYKRGLLPAPGSMMVEGLSDMIARWDPKQLRDSWEDDTQIAVVDYFTADGEPLPLSGRGALRRAVKAWQDRGYTPKVGIEFEAYALVPDDNGSFRPLPTPGSYVYGTGPHADPVGFMDGIWEAAHTAGLPLENITTEYDESQFEFVLKYDDALKAVDDAFLFKLLAREVALEYDVVLSFMPKPVADRGSSGVHINFSLFDGNGVNALGMSEQGGPKNMTNLSKSCVAGLMVHHRGLGGLLAPTVNSYDRLKPASMSGYWQNWGGDNRWVAARVSADGGSAARIEHRVTDASANPYTATAAVLQAARLGVEQGYALQPMKSSDSGEGADTDISIAADLAGALADLEADSSLTQAVGQALVDNHVFIKRAEIAEVEACDGDQAKRDYYVHYI